MAGAVRDRVVLVSEAAVGAEVVGMRALRWIAAAAKNL